MNAKLTTRNLRCRRADNWRESSYGSQRKQWQFADSAYDALCREVLTRYDFGVLVIPLEYYQ